MPQSEKTLLAVHGHEHGHDLIKVAASTLGDELTLDFTVESATLPYFKSDFSMSESCHGLWDWDVVEVFLTLEPATKGKSPRYLEFQLSPLGQHFELEVLEPRKRTNAEFRSALRKSTHLNGQKWNAQLTLEMKNLGWAWDRDWSLLRGGFYSILGSPTERRYYSSVLPPQSRPDFHLPEYFKSVF